MYNNPNFNYNPQQARLKTIEEQIGILSQQREVMLQSMQNIPQYPPIQQNFIQSGATNEQKAGSASTGNTFDFNGKWVTGYEEAEKIGNDNLPLLIFDKDSDIFYMKQLNGSMQAFKYQPVEITKPKTEVEELKDQLAMLQAQIGLLIAPTVASNINTTEQPKEPVQASTEPIQAPTVEKEKGKTGK